VRVRRVRNRCTPWRDSPSVRNERVAFAQARARLSLLAEC
jgi:hypothetical protein